MRRRGEVKEKAKRTKKEKRGGKKSEKTKRNFHPAGAALP
jgi:hypothetical protein